MTTLAVLKSTAPGGNFSMRCAQFAWIRPQNGIALVSAAGPQTAVKSLMAALNQNMKLEVRIDGAEDEEGTPISEWTAYERMGNQGSYRITTHRLGFNYVHATALLKMNGLLPCVTPEAVWNVLSGTRYTTPLLKEWVPWLMQEMESDGYLVRLPAFQCRPGLISIDEPALDLLVSRGLRTGSLAIPGKECAA